MNLHQNQAQFQDAIRLTADRMKLPASFIEKDYWVCFALYTIFQHKLGQDIIFKGGTALSKCFHLIEPRDLYFHQRKRIKMRTLNNKD
jgi:predicted nucleotidyltransferase component of viral defense system